VTSLIAVCSIGDVGYGCQHFPTHVTVCTATTSSALVHNPDSCAPATATIVWCCSIAYLVNTGWFSFLLCGIQFAGELDQARPTGYTALRMVFGIRICEPVWRQSTGNWVIGCFSVRKSAICQKLSSTELVLWYCVTLRKMTLTFRMFFTTMGLFHNNGALLPEGFF